MSKAAIRQQFAGQSGAFLDGWGPGLGATRVATREQDVAAWERMKAELPKKPPKRVEPEQEPGAE